MRLLVTRPEEDARVTAAVLRERGHDAILCPLLQIKVQRQAFSPDPSTQAVLITSANGIRALAAVTDQRDIPVFAVGPASMQAAMDLGFVNVISAAGDVDALAECVRQKCDPGSGPLLHIVGSVQAGDLQSVLRKAGFTVRRQVLYEAVPASSLPIQVIDRIRQNHIDGVMLYSPRTAAIWCDLIISAGLAEQAKRLRYLCLSAAVAVALDPLDLEGLDLEGLAPNPVLIAEQPHGAAMLVLVDQMAKGQGTAKGQL